MAAYHARFRLLELGLDQLTTQLCRDGLDGRVPSPKPSSGCTTNPAALGTSAIGAGTGFIWTSRTRERELGSGPGLISRRDLTARSLGGSARVNRHAKRSVATQIVVDS